MFSNNHFSVFKQHFTHFNALFYPHVFPQMFLNNNFQFLNTHTKWAHNVLQYMPKLGMEHIITLDHIDNDFRISLNYQTLETQLLSKP